MEYFYSPLLIWHNIIHDAPSASQDNITLSLHIVSFADSLDPHQAWQNVRPDLDSNCMTLMVIYIFLNEFFLNKKSAEHKNHEKFT